MPRKSSSAKKTGNPRSKPTRPARVVHVVQLQRGKGIGRLLANVGNLADGLGL